MAKARTRDSVRAFKKLTERVGGELRFVEDPPLIVPLEDLVLSDEARHRTERSLRKLIKKYRRTLADEHHPLEEFRYVHMARKVVGVGSVGTRAWVFLMMGVDERRPADPAGQRGPALGARALRRPRAPTATTASGWWWANA